MHQLTPITQPFVLVWQIKDKNIGKEGINTISKTKTEWFKECTENKYKYKYYLKLPLIPTL